jgi:glycosyltransferase involved in cell wall biosynthesis
VLEELSKKEAIKVATGWRAAELVWLASVEHGIPTYQVHTLPDTTGRQDPLTSDAVEAGFRKEFHYLTQSSRHRQHLRTLGIEGHTVRPAVDLDTFRVLENVVKEGDVLLASGGESSRDFEGVAKAWRRLRNPRPRLWTCGPEPRRGQGIADSQHFGPRDPSEVNRMLNQASVFVTLADDEPADVRILEAMAAGTPVICARAANVPEFCRSGDNCVVVRPDPSSLAEAIGRLLADPALRARLRSAGLRTAARHGWTAVLRDLGDFYESLGTSYSPTSRRQAPA